MAFDQSTLVGEPVLAVVGRRLVVTWSSTSPAGTYWQVYLNAALAWSGTDNRAVFPAPRELTVVEVGAVAAGEGRTDFSASLPSSSPCRALLTWQGGLWQSADLAGFRIYGSPAAGEPIDFSTALAAVPVTTAGVDLSGFGNGGFGGGGFGLASSDYSWRSGRLASGVWQFAVVPYDSAGNADGAPAVVSYTSAAAPRPPAADASGRAPAYTVLPGAGFGFGTGGFGAGGFGESDGGFGDNGFGDAGFGGGPCDYGGFGVGGFGDEEFGGDPGELPAAALTWRASPGG